MAGRGHDRKTTTVTTNGRSGLGNRLFEARRADGEVAPIADLATASQRHPGSTPNQPLGHTASAGCGLKRKFCPCTRPASPARAQPHWLESLRGDSETRESVIRCPWSQDVGGGDGVAAGTELFGGSAGAGAGGG